MSRRSEARKALRQLVNAAEHLGAFATEQVVDEVTHFGEADSTRDQLGEVAALVIAIRDRLQKAKP